MMAARSTRGWSKQRGRNWHMETEIQELQSTLEHLIASGAVQWEIDQIADALLELEHEVTL